MFGNATDDRGDFANLHHPFFELIHLISCNAQFNR
ncbi:Uncharacterised protein [Vibrio cholerae]|nr:Uncharacterised protein [Vibrio cholerae]CSI79127.1 Uncharacterised protein [Vibrio cholerae]